jgi:hypothetical protein
MKFEKKKELQNGLVRATVTYNPSKEKLISVNNRSYYQLSGLEDIVRSDTISDAKEVYWCDIQQEWVEA